VKIIECRQGSPAWFWNRLGIPTASNFDRVLTPKTRKLAAGSEKYMHELLAEWLIGMPTGGSGSAFMERGTGMEAWAVSYYELQRDVTTQAVGFCLRDDGWAGASPDRLVGDDGGLEIKCKSAVQHVAALLGDTEDHYAQAQGSMWVTGRAWWDLLIYHPEIPSKIVRYERDEEYLSKFEPAMFEFTMALRRAREKLIAMGCTPATKLAPEFAASIADQPPPLTEEEMRRADARIDETPNLETV